MPGPTNVSWLRYVGLGLELTAAVVAGVAAGWWVDHRWGTAPWGLLCGALLGSAVGLANLIRRALAASHETD